MKKLFPASSPSFPERTENAVFFFKIKTTNPGKIGTLKIYWKSKGRLFSISLQKIILLEDQMHCSIEHSNDNKKIMEKLLSSSHCGTMNPGKLFSTKNRNF